MTDMDAHFEQFGSMLDQLPQSDAPLVEWDEDDFVPLTLYEAWREGVKYRRLRRREQFLRGIAPRV